MRRKVAGEKMRLLQVIPPTQLIAGSSSSIAAAAESRTSGAPQTSLNSGNQANRAQDKPAIGVAGELALATYQGERLLSQKAVMIITSLSRTEIGRRVKAGLFPRPIARSAVFAP
jgi:hypothetical protein